MIKIIKKKFNNIDLNILLIPTELKREHDGLRVYLKELKENNTPRI